MNQIIPSNKNRISNLWIITFFGVLIALLAIFVFKVAIGTVINYSFLAAMILTHFWMHAGHGNHNNHTESASLSAPNDSSNPEPVDNNDPQNRRHGCH